MSPRTKSRTVPLVGVSMFLSVCIAPARAQQPMPTLNPGSLDRSPADSRLTSAAPLDLRYAPVQVSEGSQPPPGTEEAPPPSPEPTPPLRLHQPSYLISSERLVGEQEEPWPGFLTGMRDFDGFANPVGNPLYFESPFINTEIRFLYLWHKFPKSTNIGGGDLSVWAAQARLALSDRLAFIATKDGYSRLRAGILPSSDGWNDAAIGLKYAFYVDPEAQAVVTAGLRWQWTNGDRDILMSNVDELSPFLSFAKGWDRFHVIGNVTGRLPVDRNEGNFILSYDLHFDYEAAPEVLPGFLPLFEFHALHYLNDADRLPLGVGGLDYANLGSSRVAGNSVFWGGIGWEWKLTPHLAWSAAYEFPFHTTDTDLFDQRVTTHLALKL